ncbi:MAG: acyl-CoA carboxylase subunit beta [Dehalococcoidales bacterium]|nr:acyl-CoA carboxylase subunit beta [Dehalococcoidales bacterium]
MLPGKTHESETQRLRSLERLATIASGQQAIDSLHARGKLTARERIDELLDPGTFVELNMLAESQSVEFGMQEKKIPGDGSITGYGQIDGRLVYVFAQDSTVLGGSVGTVHGKKICYLMDEAIKVKAPIFGLCDSGGGRIHEGFTATEWVAGMFYRNTAASGVVPQLSAVMGTCAGVAAYSPAITDFLFMVDSGSEMAITGPAVIKSVTGEKITMVELGGAKVHSEITGTAHLVGRTEQECLSIMRRVFSYLPSNNTKLPPVVQTGDDPDRLTPNAADVVPPDVRKVYDMRKVIAHLVDNGEFLEILPRFARNMVIGFARMDCQTVGIIANQPLFMAGSLDVNAADKAARFIRFCDAFNIPLVNLVDVPGFLPGVRQEHSAIIRHGAKMLYAYAEATVPKITLVLRKNYGGAVMAMCSVGMGVDEMLAWPIAQMAVLDTATGVRLIYRKEIKEAEDPTEFVLQKIEEYDRKYSNPFDAAGKMLVHAVIEPEQSRRRIIQALRRLRDKQQARPERKHGNIPL